MTVTSAFLRAERRPTVAWALGLGAFVLVHGLVYSSFEDPAQLDRLLESYPPEVMEIFGDIEEIGSVSGFLQVELRSYMPALLGVFAVMLMTKHLAGAEERGSLDHLLSRPITRMQYYWGLLAAGLGVHAATMAGTTLGGWAGFAGSGLGPADYAGILGMMVEFLPTSALYLGLGGLLGASFHRRGAANGLGVAVVLAMWVLDVVGRLVDGWDWLTYATPHGYLGRSDLFHGELDPGYLLFSVAVGLALAVAGALRFERKDLHA